MDRGRETSFERGARGGQIELGCVCECSLEEGFPFRAGNDCGWKGADGDEKEEKEGGCNLNMPTFGQVHGT